MGGAAAAREGGAGWEVRRRDERRMAPRPASSSAFHIVNITMSHLSYHIFCIIKSTYVQYESKLWCAPFALARFSWFALARTIGLCGALPVRPGALLNTLSNDNRCMSSNKIKFVGLIREEASKMKCAFPQQSTKHLVVFLDSFLPAQLRFLLR